MLFSCAKVLCELYKSKVKNEDVKALKEDPCLCLLLKVSWPSFPLLKTAAILLILTAPQNFIITAEEVSQKVGYKASVFCNSRVKEEVGRLHHQVELRGATSCYQTEPGASKKKWYLPHSCVQRSFSKTVFASTETSDLGPDLIACVVKNTEGNPVASEE